jgi:lauroyl/myristoyl acyltransferase
MGYRMLSIRGLSPPRFGRLAQPWLGPRTRRLAELMLSESEYVNRKDPDCSLRATQRLRDGGIVFLCPDVGGSRAVEVPFLRGSYRVGSGVLSLARLSGAPVVPLTTSYAGHRLRIELGEPLPLRSQGTAEECNAANLPILVAELERQVRAYPDQWEKWLPR